MYDLYQIITRKENEFCHTIEVHSEKDEIILRLIAFRKPESKIKIHYKKVGEDTLVESDVEGDKSRKKEIKVEDKDFVSVFCDDLESLLLHRNTQLDRIKLEDDKLGVPDESEYKEEEYIEFRRHYLNPTRAKYYERLASILRYRHQILQVKKIHLEITDENKITSLLPYIDPSTVDYFHLTLDTSDPTVTLAEMWSLDFWRLAKPHVTIYVHTLVKGTLIALKEAFFTNPNLNEVYIEAMKSSLSDEMKDQFNGNIKIPNTDQEMLRICYFGRYGEFVVSFTRIKIPTQRFNDRQKIFGEDYISTRNQRIKKSLLKLLEPKKRCEVAEDLQAKSAINIMNVLENDIILKIIMEYVPFPGNQILRKVSRDIRQHIDRIKPDPAIKNWSFSIRGFNKIKVYNYTRDGLSRGWSYAKQEDGCSVKSNYFEKILEYKYVYEDFRMRCLKDFEINTKHRPSAFHTLIFHTRIDSSNDDRDINLTKSTTFQTAPFYGFQFGLWDDHDADINSTESSIFPFLEAFEEFFKSKTPLKVKRLEMNLMQKITTVLQQNEVMKVLPLLDPNILETIDFLLHNTNSGLILRLRGIETLNEEKTPIVMEVNEISKQEQWKNAKELNINHCTILTPIQEMNITHFSKGNVTVQTISLEDLQYLKEGFQNSSTLEKFKISFKECTFQEFRNDDIYQFMGMPHKEANPLLINQRNIWFLRMPNCDTILHIVHFVGQYITFSAVEPSEVPENAWIHD